MRIRRQRFQTGWEKGEAVAPRDGRGDPSPCPLPTGAPVCTVPAPPAFGWATRTLGFPTPLCVLPSCSLCFVNEEPPSETPPQVGCGCEERATEGAWDGAGQGRGPWERSGRRPAMEETRSGAGSGRRAVHRRGHNPAHGGPGSARHAPGRKGRWAAPRWTQPRGGTGGACSLAGPPRSTGHSVTSGTAVVHYAAPSASSGHSGGDPARPGEGVC